MLDRESLSLRVIQKTPLTASEIQAMRELRQQSFSLFPELIGLHFHAIENEQIVLCFVHEENSRDFPRRYLTFAELSSEIALIRDSLSLTLAAEASFSDPDDF